MYINMFGMVFIPVTGSWIIIKIEYQITVVEMNIDPVSMVMRMPIVKKCTVKMSRIEPHF